jgi:hypothetical protein
MAYNDQENQESQNPQDDGSSWPLVTISGIAILAAFAFWFVNQNKPQSALIAPVAPSPVVVLQSPAVTTPSPTVSPTAVPTPATNVNPPSATTVQVAQPATSTVLPKQFEQPLTEASEKKLEDATKKALNAALELEIKTRQIENAAKPAKDQKQGPGF